METSRAKASYTIFQQHYETMTCGVNLFPSPALPSALSSSSHGVHASLATHHAQDRHLVYARSPASTRYERSHHKSRPSATHLARTHRRETVQESAEDGDVRGTDGSDADSPRSGQN